MALEEIADQLYGLAPEEFTAARSAAAKRDRPNAKAIAALRKPTVSAWLVNGLVRGEPDLLNQLLDLGPALAKAQSAGQGDALRALGEQRRQLVNAVTARAFALAGRQRAGSALDEVASTLEAALADPASAEAVRSGRLVRALSYAGFGGVDLAGAVAGPVTTGPARVTDAPGKRAARAPKEKPDTRARDIAAAEERALEAGGALDDAVGACESAQAALAGAEEDEATAAQAVLAADAALTRAREERTAAEEATRQATRQASKAEQAVHEAQAQAEKARAVLDRLRRS